MTNINCDYYYISYISIILKMLNRDELVQELKIFDFYVSSKILNPSAIKT